MKDEINVILKYYKSYFVMFPYMKFENTKNKIKNSNKNKFISSNLK